MLPENVLDCGQCGFVAKLEREQSYRFAWTQLPSELRKLSEPGLGRIELTFADHLRHLNAFQRRCG